MRPVIEAFTPKLLGPKDWGEEWLIAQTETYIGKVLFMRSGASGPMQYHRKKDETFYLLSGSAVVRRKDEHGNIIEADMFPGESYHIPPGAIHQVEAVTDCVFVEASTPHFNDRVTA